MENTNKTYAQFDEERNGEVRINFHIEEEKNIGKWQKYATTHHIIHIENKNILINWDEAKEKKIIIYNKITNKNIVVAGKKRAQKDFIYDLVVNIHNDTKMENIENALKCMCIKYIIGE